MDVSQNPSVQEHCEALGHRGHGWGIARGRSHGEQEVGQVFVTQVRSHSLQQVGIQNVFTRKGLYSDETTLGLQPWKRNFMYLSLVRNCYLKSNRKKGFQNHPKIQIQWHCAMLLPVGSLKV